MEKILKVNFLIRLCKKFVEELHKDSDSLELPFHNLENTKAVVRTSKKLAKQSSLGKLDTLVLLGATWFINTGYLKTRKHPEKESLALAQSFFLTYGLAKEYSVRFYER